MGLRGFIEQEMDLTGRLSVSAGNFLILLQFLFKIIFFCFGSISSVFIHFSVEAPVV